MSTRSLEYYLFTSWRDFTDYGIKLYQGQACPYKFRNRLLMDDHGADYLARFFGTQARRESILVPTDMWMPFAKWVLVSIEKCKYVGVTTDGKVAGTNTPENVEFIDASWNGPYTHYPETR